MKETQVADLLSEFEEFGDTIINALHRDAKEGKTFRRDLARRMFHFSIKLKAFCAFHNKSRNGLGRVEKLEEALSLACSRLERFGGFDDEFGVFLEKKLKSVLNG